MRDPPILPQATLQGADCLLVLAGHLRIVHRPPPSLAEDLVTHAPPSVHADGHLRACQPCGEGHRGQRRSRVGGAERGSPVRQRLCACGQAPRAIPRRREVPGHPLPALPSQDGHQRHHPRPPGDKGPIGTPNRVRPVPHHAPKPIGRHALGRPALAEVGAGSARLQPHGAQQPLPPLARHGRPAPAPPGRQAPTARAGRAGGVGVDHAPPPHVAGGFLRRHVVQPRSRPPPALPRPPEARRWMAPLHQHARGGGRTGQRFFAPTPAPSSAGHSPGTAPLAGLPPHGRGCRDGWRTAPGGPRAPAVATGCLGSGGAQPPRPTHAPSGALAPPPTRSSPGAGHCAGYASASWHPTSLGSTLLHPRASLGLSPVFGNHYTHPRHNREKAWKGHG